MRGWLVVWAVRIRDWWVEEFDEALSLVVASGQMCGKLIYSTVQAGSVLSSSVCCCHILLLFLLRGRLA